MAVLALIVAVIAIGLLALPPLLYIVRRLMFTRSRPPIVPIAILGQHVLFTAVLFFLYQCIIPKFARIFASHNARLPLVTEIALDTSYRMQNGWFAAAFLVLACATLRITGRSLKRRWRDHACPAWKLDLAGLTVWILMAVVVSMSIIAMYLPIFKISVCVSGHK